MTCQSDMSYLRFRGVTILDHQPLVFIKPLIPRFQPRVPHNSALCTYFRHRLINPRCNIQPCWSTHCAISNALGSHLLYPQPPNVVFEWLIKADVDELTKGGASSWDVLDLHPKLLDLLNYQCQCG